MSGVLASFCMVALLTNASHTGSLHWESDYGAALRAARAAKRPLLVVIEKPGSAGERFDADRLATGQQHKELLGRFQLCRVNAETKIGRRIAHAFGAREFPYTSITDKATRVIKFRHAGQMSGDTWLSALATHDQLAVVSGQSVTVDSNIRISTPVTHPPTRNHSWPAAPRNYAIPARSPSKCFT